VAGRTKIGPDEAFLTGLLHGIGRLYIMVRSISKAREFGDEQSFIELVAGWQASIGKAVLENWGFAAEMCEAVAEQRDYERKRKRVAELTDVLIVSIVLCEALRCRRPGRSTPKASSPSRRSVYRTSPCADHLDPGGTPTRFVAGRARG